MQYHPQYQPNPGLVLLLRDQWASTLRLTGRAILAVLYGTWLAVTGHRRAAETVDDVRLPF